MGKVGRFFRKSLPYIGGLAGGLAGSVIPGVGTGLGAGIGYGLGRGVSSQLPRSQPQMTRADLVNQLQASDPGTYGDYEVTNLPRGMQALKSPRYSPEDEATFNRLRDMGLTTLQNAPRAEFGPISEEIQRQYKEDVVPGIMEQFRGGDALRSSGLQQTLGSSATGLQSKLAAYQQMFNQQQRGQELGLGQDLLKAGLGRKFDTQILGGDPQYWSGAQGDDDSSEFDRYAYPITENILDQMESYFSEEKGKGRKNAGSDQIKNLARMLVYDRLKKQASLPLNN